MPPVDLIYESLSICKNESYAIKSARHRFYCLFELILILVLICTVHKFKPIYRQKLLRTKNDEEKCILASLPIRNGVGGIGIRRIRDISIPLFLSSAIGVFDLICTIIPTSQTDLLDISD